jgi:hypothetical protein
MSTPARLASTSSQTALSRISISSGAVNAIQAMLSATAKMQAYSANTTKRRGRLFCRRASFGKMNIRAAAG